MRLIEKIPICREVFTNFVMIGATTSIICLSNVVWIGSSSQCFGGAFVIVTLTSFSVTILKVLICLSVSNSSQCTLHLFGLDELVSGLP